MLTPAELRERLEACAARAEAQLERTLARQQAYLDENPMPINYDMVAQDFIDPQLYIGLGAIYAGLANLKDS